MGEAGFQGPHPLEDLIEATVRIAREAGGRIMTVYDSDFAVETKEDKSPLTAADLAAHECIVAGLEALTPEVPILSEESATRVDAAQRLAWGRFWLVDPLDGTKEFIKRNGEFTVNIALIDGHRPVLGVVYVPAFRTTYLAAEGLGAFREDETGERRAINAGEGAKPPYRVVGSRSHGGSHLQSYAEGLGEHELVVSGSSLKLCLVAEGRADVYPRFGPTSEWDTAAAQAVVECAGGRVTTLDGTPLSYNTRESVLNPYFIVFGDSRSDWFTPIPAALLEEASERG